jgi:hypothetical protein
LLSLLDLTLLGLSLLDLTLLSLTLLCLTLLNLALLLRRLCLAGLSRCRPLSLFRIFLCLLLFRVLLLAASP